VKDDALKGAGILIVDDEMANVRLLERLLGRAGYTNLRNTTDPRQVLPLFGEFEPDLILLDLLMPGLDGFAVMGQLGPLIPEGTYLPILVLTADATPETKRQALAAGARDFLTKPLDAVEVLLRIKNLLETRLLYLALQGQNERLEEQVRERTQRLLQTEKVATMGELLAGVAHELNNPLSVIVGRTALLRQQVGTGPLAHHAEKIAQSAGRCARIVGNFLALARQRPPERQRVWLNKVVQESVELLAYQLRVANVEVEFRLADDLPQIWADPHQLQQVVVNLVTNAHHAMRELRSPRRLTVSTRRGEGRVHLAVADTGPGIPPEIQGRIFEPFFTTKPQGQGTGLGLSLCRGIVEGHGGMIRAKSEPGKGGAFLIDLPVGTPPVVEPEVAAPGAVPLVRGKRILVADDEPEVTALLAEMLALDGHHVDTAPNGAVALQKLREQRYDVIVSDCGMPELDGPALYREAECVDPRLARRFVFLSGDTLNPKNLEFLERAGVRRLAKPFTLDEVRGLVQQALREQ